MMMIDCSFALLGPSGCGKTSLIRTLIGRLHPIDNHDGTRGTLSILGQETHAFGQLVGFMPQEMALHTTNTIGEELFFYGRLTNMSHQRIEQRCQFLTNLLDLPSRRTSIDKLSGGQQRRVSFAIALIHQPRLLVLGRHNIGRVQSLSLQVISRFLSSR
jgi:ABC-type multidrug transport system ATPase subunit